MNIHWSDGNLHALNEYLKKEDAFYAHEERIQAKIRELMEDRDSRIDAIEQVDSSELVDTMIYGKTKAEREAARSRLDDLIRKTLESAVSEE